MGFQCRYLTDSSDWTLAPPMFRMVLRTFGQFTVRSVRCIMERSVSTFFQLEARSQSGSSACLSPGMVQPHTLCFPSICIGGSLSSETAQRGSGVCSDDSSSVACASLVPCPPEYAGGIASSSSNSPRPSDELQRGTSSTNGHLTLAAWPVSGAPSRREEFQRRLVTLSVPHGGEVQTDHIMLDGIDGLVVS